MENSHINKITKLELKSMLYSSQEYIIGMKLLALFLMKKGMSARKLEKLFEISHSRFCVWAKNFEENGIEGLKNKPKTGRKSKLNEKQKTLLKNVLKENRPKKYGYKLQSWNGPSFGDFIKCRFGIKYKKAQIYNIMKVIDYSINEKHDKKKSITLNIRQYPGENMRSLVVNGHHTAYTTIKDLSVNRQLGYMPYILHPNPKKAMVVGFGLGATTNALVQPDIEIVDVAEICPGVIQAAPAFAKWNDNAVNNPKVKIHDEDGRSWLFMAEDKTYDIITSNAIHPRLSNNIYTREFYEICKDKLADDGIVCQWMPQNWINEDEYLACVKAFVDVFPNSTLWYVNEYSTHIIGSEKPIKITYEKAARAFENEKIKKELSTVGIIDPEFFLAQYFMSSNELKEYIKNAPVNTDVNPIVEFSKVINIAPVKQVMIDLMNHSTNYDEIIDDVKDEQSRYEIKDKIMQRTTFIRNIMNEVIEKVEYYERNPEYK